MRIGYQLLVQFLLGFFLELHLVNSPDKIALKVYKLRINIIRNTKGWR